MKKTVIFVLVAIFCLQSFAQNQQYLEYIETYKSIAIQKMQTYGIPASITLAQGLLESGAGKGRLAMQANNHFGIKCQKNWTGATISHDDDAKGECFRKYADPMQSYEDHSAFLKSGSRYAFLFNFESTDYKSWAFGLKQAGYATDPKYPVKLINLIEAYNLQQYDTMQPMVKNDEQKQVSVSENEPIKKSFFARLFSKSDASQTATTEENKVYNDGVYLADIEPFRTHAVEEINGVKCVIAKEGDTYAGIADEFAMFEKELLKANEVKYGSNPKPGDIVFLAKKKKRGTGDSYLFREGDTMYNVSQLKGIRVRALYRINNMIYGKQPEVGAVIKLR